MALPQASFVSNLPAAFMLQIAEALQKGWGSRVRGKLPFDVAMEMYVWRGGHESGPLSCKVPCGIPHPGGHAHVVVG